MGMTMDGTRALREMGAGRREITVDLSRFAYEALTHGRTDAAASVRMESALRCYLGDRGTDRPAWRYPGFLRGSETQGDVRIELEIGEDLWTAFTQEGEKQGVTVEQLAEHAAFYFAAELDAGRVTQRILDDLEASGESGAAD